MKGGERIPFEGLRNTRDLGGIPAAGGKAVRGRLLLRSGELFPASAQDLCRLEKEYSLRRIVDFRTSAEQKMKPDPKISGAAHISNPILDEEAMGITHGEKAGEGGDWLKAVMDLAERTENAPERYMEAMYRNLVTASFAKRQYGKFLRLLSEPAGGAVLYHCTAGKDRVGTGTALLLLALGAERADIAEDYMKTGEYFREQIEEIKSEVLRRTGDSSLAESAAGLYGVRESYIRTVFSEIGDEKRYFRDALGLSETELGRLREIFLA